MIVLFMGTPDFAEESLKSIYDAGYEVVSVVTNPDRPKGRGMKMIASPVKEFAVSKSIPVLQPEKIRGNVEFLEQVKSLNPDIAVVVAYGKILPKELLELPKLGSINVHGSLLPQYRGAAPIQWSVINGDEQTGITTMYMDEGMDTGDMILQEAISIGSEETTGELWDRMAKLGGKLLVETLDKIQAGTAQRIKQPENSTYAPMLEKSMAQIDWNKSAKELHNLIRGLNPIIGAYTYFNNKKIKIWKSKVVQIDEYCNPDECIAKSINKKVPGQVVSTKPSLVIYTGDGYLEILEVQPENSKKMSARDFLNGTKILEGDILGA